MSGLCCCNRACKISFVNRFCVRVRVRLKGGCTREDSQEPRLLETTIGYDAHIITVDEGVPLHKIKYVDTREKERNEMVDGNSTLFRIKFLVSVVNTVNVQKYIALRETLAQVKLALYLRLKNRATLATDAGHVENRGVRFRRVKRNVIVPNEV